MVFALAGDSTMTKPFDNFSSMWLEYVFEASTNVKWGTSYRQSRELRATSFEQAGWALAGECFA